MAAWIIVVGWLTKLVLVILVVLSVWSIKIIFERLKSFQLYDDSSEETQLRIYLESKTPEKIMSIKLVDGIRVGLLQKLYLSKALNGEKLDRLSRSFLIQKKTVLDQDMGVLSTLGSNAPFIGLFGTVLGIIQAFGVLALGTQSDGSTSVMSGISEALIATAVGLFVAIPAVVAFNVFNRKIKKIQNDCDSLKELFIANYGS